MKDFILNSGGGLAVQGPVANVLLKHNFDPNALRPWVGSDGRSYVTVNDNGTPRSVPLINADATLRKNEWIMLDQAVIRAARARLAALNRIRGAGLEFTIPNGMGKTILEYQTMSDPGRVTKSMDGLRRGENDRPVFDLRPLPLPITHGDFSFSARQLAVSRSDPTGTPLDLTMPEAVARRLAEDLETDLIGRTDTYSYGGAAIYGLTTLSQRNTKTLTSPATGGWTPATTLQEVLQMKTQSQDDFFFGPWAAFCSTDWDEYMDDDFSAAKGDLTLRQRIGLIDGITAPVTLDYLPKTFTLILVQLTQDVIRIVIGMDFITVQWQEQGGMELNFKIMCIMVPQLRYDYNGRCGIVHGSV